MDIEATADTLMWLINSRPTSPTRDEVVALLRARAQPLPIKLGEWKMVDRVVEGKITESKITPLVKRLWNYTIYDAFAAFQQSVGPTMAYNERRNNEGEVIERCVYQTFALKARDLDKIVGRVVDLCSQLKSRGVTSIVWRSTPDLVEEPDGTIYFYSRFHVLPYMSFPGAKPEGAETPEA